MPKIPSTAKTKAVAKKVAAPANRWTAPPLDEPGEGDVIVSYSELDTYRQCPLKHLIAYRERWTKPQPEDSPLAKGTLWHAVMERHFLAIQKLQHGELTEQEALDGTSIGIAELLWDQKTGEQSEVQSLIWWMYKGYVERYRLDPQWEVLAVEQKFQQRLPNADGTPSRYILKGKLDLVVRDRKTRKIWIVDHKSGANLPSEMELDLDDQFGLYLWLLRSAGIDVIGVIHDAARTTRNTADHDGYDGKLKPQTLEQRMRRTLMSRGQRELDAIGRDAWAVAVNAYPEAAGRPALPLYTSPDPRQCGWKCDYLDAHLITRKGRNLQTALAELGFEQNYERH